MSMMINAPTAFQSEQFRTAIGPLVATQDTALGGFTVIGKYAPKFIASGGAGVRLTLQGFLVAGHTATINSVTVALASSTKGAKAWDAVAAPTAVTFGGSVSVTLSRGSIHVSDQITFALDGTKALLIGYNLAAGAYVSFSGGLGPNNFLTYRKTGVQEADDQTRGANYVALGGYSPFLQKLETFS
jgi:hypothetical protein